MAYRNQNLGKRGSSTPPTIGGTSQSLTPTFGGTSQSLTHAFGRAGGPNPILIPGSASPPPLVGLGPGGSEFSGIRPFTEDMYKAPQVMARWNCVPFQIAHDPDGDGIMKIGVVAHDNWQGPLPGIQRVDFRIDGGGWFPVFLPSLNDQTNTVEYWSQLDINGLADGLHEIEAVAYSRNLGSPVIGDPGGELVYPTHPRYLQGGIKPVPATTSNNDYGLTGGQLKRGEHSMYIWTNRDGDLAASGLGANDVWVDVNGSDTTGTGKVDNPFQHIAVAIESYSGGINRFCRIYLKTPGVYEWWNAEDNPSYTGELKNPKCSTGDCFLTIEPDPALNITDPTLKEFEIRTNKSYGIDPEKNPAGSIRSRHKIHWKNVAFNTYYIQYMSYGSDYDIYWFDNCYDFDPNGWDMYDIAQKKIYTHYAKSPNFHTDCKAYDKVMGLGGTGLVLARNCTQEKISGEVFRNPSMVLNCTIDWVDGLLSWALHSDCLQYFGGWTDNPMPWDDPESPSVIDNVIIQNYSGINLESVQSFLLQAVPSWNTPPPSNNNKMINCAFIDMCFINSGSVVSQLQSNFNHIYFRNLKMPNESIAFRTDYKAPPCPPSDSSMFSPLGFDICTHQDVIANGGCVNGIPKNSKFWKSWDATACTGCIGSDGWYPYNYYACMSQRWNARYVVFENCVFTPKTYQEYAAPGAPGCPTSTTTGSCIGGTVPITGTKFINCVPGPDPWIPGTTCDQL